MKALRKNCIAQLLQISELREREDQNKALVEVFESLSNERDQLTRQVEELNEQIGRQNEERATAEDAWQALRNEAAGLSEVKQRLEDENAKLLASDDEIRTRLEQSERDHAALAEAAATLDRELAARRQADAAAAAAVAENEQKLAEQARRFAESINTLERELADAKAHATALAASTVADGEQKLSERERQFAEAFDALQQQLAAATEAQKALEQACDECQRQIAESENDRAAQTDRIRQLEAELTAAEARTAQLLARTVVPCEAARDEKIASGDLHSPALADEVAESIDAPGEPASPLASDGPKNFNWSSFRRDSISKDMPHASGQVAENSDQSAAEERQSTGAESNAGEMGDAPDEPIPWQSHSSAQVPAEANSFGGEEASIATHQDATNWGVTAELNPQAETRDDQSSPRVFELATTCREAGVANELSCGSSHS